MPRRRADAPISAEIDIALQPKQEDLYRLVSAEGPDVATVIGYGGARGGGKSGAIRRIMMARRFENPGTVGFIMRRRYKDLKENHIEKFRLEYPELDQYYRTVDAEYVLPNKSRVVFRYADTTDEITQISRGPEAMDIFLDQAEAFTEKELIMIRTPNRWPGSNPGQPKMVYFFNPGGPGTEYLRRIFWLHQYKADENPNDFVFLQAYGWDNYEWFRNEVAGITEKSFYDLDNDARFELFIKHTSEGKKMNSLPPALRVGELLGSFESFSGQYFAGVWDEDLVVRKQADLDRIIQPWWKRWTALDWGFAHYSAAGWAASGKLPPAEFKRIFGIDTEWPIDVVVVYRELVVNETGELEFVQKMDALTPGSEKRELRNNFIPSDTEAKRGDAKTVFEQLAAHFKRYGFPQPDHADRDRIGGWRLMHNCLKQTCSLLGSAFVTKEMAVAGPMLLMSADCVAIGESLPLLIRDPDNLEDVLKTDSRADDVGDMVRYLLKSMLDPRIKAPRDVRAQEVMQQYEDINAKAMAMLKFNAAEKHGKPGFVRRMRVR